MRSHGPVYTEWVRGVYVMARRRCSVSEPRWMKIRMQFSRGRDAAGEVAESAEKRHAPPHLMSSYRQGKCPDDRSRNSAYRHGSKVHCDTSPRRQVSFLPVNWAAIQQSLQTTDKCSGRPWFLRPLQGTYRPLLTASSGATGHGLPSFRLRFSYLIVSGHPHHLYCSARNHPAHARRNFQKLLLIVSRE